MRSDYSDAIRLFRNDVAYPQIESRMQDGEQGWIRAAKRHKITAHGASRG